MRALFLMAPQRVLILGDELYAGVLTMCSDEERAAIEDLRDRGEIIVSSLLPDGVDGYEYNGPDLTRFNWDVPMYSPLWR